MPTLNRIKCPHCGQSVNERQIAIFTELVGALLRVLIWCEEKGVHEFKRKDIKHLLTSDNQIARFGDWILFGGIVYRPGGKKGWYGINIHRARLFFAGKYPIPTVIWKNPITKQLRKENYKSVFDIPHLREHLTTDFEFIARYKDYKEDLFNNDLEV